MEEDIFIGAEDIDNISEEQMEELEGKVEEYQSLLEEYEKEVNEQIREINDSDVYKELDIKVSVDMDYYYSIQER